MHTMMEDPSDENADKIFEEVNFVFQRSIFIQGEKKEQTEILYF